MSDENKPIWVVGTNLALIKNKPDIYNNHTWVQQYPGKASNMISAKFDNKSKACDLYNELRKQKLPATKNWID